jgi:tetratricopeptide (TPR) repeat protein
MQWQSSNHWLLAPKSRVSPKRPMAGVEQTCNQSIGGVQVGQCGETVLANGRFAKPSTSFLGCFLSRFRTATCTVQFGVVIVVGGQNFGPEHLETASALNNLAALQHATNRLSEAEHLMRRALAIDEASFGEDRPNVATDLNNLALLLKATNRLSEAEPLMRRALGILAEFARETGHEQPKLSNCIDNYRNVLKAMKLPQDEIERRIREALEQ